MINVSTQPGLKVVIDEILKKILPSVNFASLNSNTLNLFKNLLKINIWTHIRERS